MAEWKKIVVSGSDISQLNNDSGYLTSGGTIDSASVAARATTLSPDATASFADLASNARTADSASVAARATSLSADATASFADVAGTVHDGNITAAKLSSDAVTTVKITDGNVTNAKLANDSVTVGSTEIDLGTAATTLAGLTSVTSTGFTGELSATSTLADGVVATTQASGDNSTKVATTEYVDAAAGAATLNIESGNDSSAIAIDLDSETLTVTGNDGLTFNNAGNDVNRNYRWWYCWS